MANNFDMQPDKNRQCLQKCVQPPVENTTSFCFLFWVGRPNIHSLTSPLAASSPGCPGLRARQAHTHEDRGKGVCPRCKKGVARATRACSLSTPVMHTREHSQHPHTIAHQQSRRSLKTHLAPIVTVTHRMMVHKARQSTGHVHRATYGHLSQQPFTASFLE
jgi:hypothetical protein